MATIQALVQPQNDGSTIVSWLALNATDNAGSLVSLPSLRLASIQATGTFGGAVTMHGTNDATGAAAVVPLKDSAGAAISATAAAMFGVAGQMRHVQPKAAAGVSSVDVHALYVPKG